MDSIHKQELADLYFALGDAKNPLHFLFRSNSDFLVMASYLNSCGFSRSKNQTGVWIPVIDPHDYVDHPGDLVLYYKCSVCGRRESTKEPYCHCGVKMKE